MNVIILMICVLLIIIKSEKLLIIPFESYHYVDEETILSTSYIDRIYASTLYSKSVSIGQPYLYINTFFESDSHNIYINNNCPKSTEYKKTYYNWNNSKTFKNYTDFNIAFKSSSKACEAEETFSFLELDSSKNRLRTQINNLKFIIESPKLNDNNCLCLGLRVSQGNSKFSDYVFVDQLKKKHIIHNYEFSLILHLKENDHSSKSYLDYKGDLILGEKPHIYDPINYHESQLRTIYIKNNIIDNWNIEFNNVYMIGKDNKEIKISVREVRFNFNNHLIQAPSSLLLNLENTFFKELIEQKKCSKIYLGSSDTIKCTSAAKEDLKKFPTIYFKSIELEYTFELGFEDLFVYDYDTYYFLCFFEAMFDIDVWVLSLPFLRKYNFTFNTEKKQVGFYNPNIEIINIENKSYIKLVLYYIIFAIFFVVIGLFIGKNIFNKIKNRKKAFQLEDEYDYDYKIYDNQINNGKNANSNDDKKGRNLEMFLK